MKAQLTDRKTGFVYALWSTINKIVISLRFRRITVEGKEHLPKDGPFLLISNHTSRWDGLLAYHLINRPANFMVSPNELLGLQGHVLSSMGAFPANARFDLIAHMQRQIAKGEGIVIFPEGDTYRDGTTHRFKSGAARFILSSAASRLKFPVIPMAVRYSEDGHAVSVKLAPAIDIGTYLHDAGGQPAAIKDLTARLHREVCFLKYELGHEEDVPVLFAGDPPTWAA